MKWVFLSPHFDDAVFSCGGLIWEKVNAAETAQVWTICAGDIPPGKLSAFVEDLHQRWGMGSEAIESRLREDDLACLRLSAVPFRLPLPDCIYRREGENYFDAAAMGVLSEDQFSHLYPSETAIFGEIHPAEDDLVGRLSSAMAVSLPEDAELVCPLTVGGHVDHRLVRAAAERLHRQLWYYLDLPYALNDDGAIGELVDQELERVHFPISEAGIDAWIDAISAYVSQIPTFWEDRQSISSSIRTFLGRMGGFWLIKGRLTRFIDA